MLAREALEREYGGAAVGEERRGRKTVGEPRDGVRGGLGLPGGPPERDVDL